MDNGYIDENENRALCCWDAPDQESVEDLFSKAGVSIDTIKKVDEYP